MFLEHLEPSTYLGGLLIAVIGWFARKELATISQELAMKADKEAMEREIAALLTQGEALRSELRDARETRERDIERLERMYDGKITAMANQLQERMNGLERNLETKMDMLLKMLTQRGVQ